MACTAGSTSLNPNYIVEQKCCTPDCPLRTNLTFPHCATCTRTVEGLHVGGTTLGIHKALFGLFAWRENAIQPVFRKGSCIGIYNGKKVTGAHVATMNNEDKCYLLITQTNKITYADGSSTSTGVCRYINDPGDLEKCNAEFKFVVPIPYAPPSPKRKNDHVRVIMIIALRDIFHGEEIFMSYGNTRFIPRVIDDQIDGEPCPTERTLRSGRKL